MPQPGFFDLDERYARLNERDPLVKLNPIIDWEAFREPLSVLRKPPRKSQAGRKPCDVVLTCLLQAGLEDKLPDAGTIWLFREQPACSRQADPA